MGLLDTLGTVAGVLSPAFGSQLFGQRSRNDQLDAQTAAAAEQEERERAAQAVDESRRGSQLDAIQALLGGLEVPGSGSLTFDPAALAGMRQARPYVGQVQADPKAGASNAFLSGLMGGITNAGLSLAGLPGGMGGAPKPPSVVNYEDDGSGRGTRVTSGANKPKPKPKPRPDSESI